jgi:hypothetical protein
MKPCRHCGGPKTWRADGKSFCRPCKNASRRDARERTGECVRCGSSENVASSYWCRLCREYVDARILRWVESEIDMTCRELADELGVAMRAVQMRRSRLLRRAAASVAAIHMFEAP